MIEPTETDKVFTDSPGAGEPACICSRCLNRIKENEVPLRFHDTTDNTEMRFCDNCQRASGIMFIESDENLTIVERGYEQVQDAIGDIKAWLSKDEFREVLEMLKENICQRLDEPGEEITQ